jgi:hypothetical protein
MRTSHHAVSSAQRLSSWLIAVLGLAAYVGLVYALTLVPIQLEMPLPGWAGATIPPLAYGLLVLLWVRRPSIVRWLVGTAILSGLHVLLGMSREPLSALLDPALTGRPLPWVLPPPFPEVIGLMLLLVPLRDVLHAPVRLARERGAGPGRPVPSPRVRTAPLPRVQPATMSEGSGSLSETLLARKEPVTEPAPAVAAAPPPVPPAPPVTPAEDEEPRRRRATARAERQRRAEPAVPVRRSRSDVVLRIPLDRIMGQLPPGTFLAPEEEVAASLTDPGHLRIPGELVVTQLAEGVARIAWADIASQFPRHLVGLSQTEINEHLAHGLRLPLDEVIGQLPHELFVADTPEVEMPGLDRIPVPFRPMEESDLAPSLQPEPTAPAELPIVATAAPAPVAVVAPPAVEPPPDIRPVHVAPERPAMSVSVEAPAPPAPEPLRRVEPASIEAVPAAAGPDGPTVRVSFARVAAEIPPDAFRAPLEQVSERLRQPGSLLVAQSAILPQLAEGVIQIGWDAVAPQFHREDLAVTDAEMAERLPNGIRLPLDEIIRQVPADLFVAAGPPADVRGLESFPAPFQPLLSDPAPGPSPAVAVTAPAEPEEPSSPAVPPAEPVLVVSAERDVVAPHPAVVEPQSEPVPVVDATEGDVPEETGEVAEAAIAEMVGPDLPIAIDPSPVADEPSLAVAAQIPVSEPLVPATPRWAPTAPIEAARAWIEPAPTVPMPTAPVAGPGEVAEARRIAALLAPIAAFDVSVQAVEGVTVFAMASPAVAQETAVAVAGLAQPLLLDGRLPWPVEQITLRGPETALVLTPLAGPDERGSILAAAAPRGGVLALLEILCRRAAGGHARRPASRAHDEVPPRARALAPAPMPSRAEDLAPALSAFGDVTASVLRDAESEAVFYFFLPRGGDVPAVGAFAQDLQAVMRKAAGSGAVFRTAILRSGDTLLVIQPEEIGHGRSIVIVAGGSVTRPGMAYRQVDRAAATLMSA